MRRYGLLVLLLLLLLSVCAAAGDTELRAWALTGQLADAWTTRQGIEQYGVGDQNPGPMGRLTASPWALYLAKAAVAEGTSRWALGAGRGCVRRADELERRAFAPGLEQAERVRLLRASRGERAAARWARRIPVVIGALGWAAAGANMVTTARYCGAHPNAPQCGSRAEMSP